MAVGSARDGRGCLTCKVSGHDGRDRGERQCTTQEKKSIGHCETSLFTLSWGPTPTTCAFAASGCSALLSTSIRFVLRSASQRFLAPLAVQQLFDELDALEVHQLRVLLEATIERHRDLPLPGKDLWVFDRRLVADHIRRGPRIAFDDMELVTVEVAGTIE